MEEGGKVLAFHFPHTLHNLIQQNLILKAVGADKDLILGTQRAVNGSLWISNDLDSASVVSQCKASFYYNCVALCTEVPLCKNYVTTVQSHNLF